MPSQPSNLPAMIRLDLTNAASGNLAKIYGLLTIMAVIFIPIDGPSLGITFIALAGYLAAINLVKLDESYSLANLYGTLPVTRRIVITSHYLVTGLMIAVSGALGAAIFLTVAATTGRSATLASDLSTIVVTIMCIAVLVMLQWPLVLKYGARRLASIVVLVVLGLVSLAAAVAPLVDLKGLVASVATLPGWVATSSSALLILCTIAVSYHLSQRIYAAQDH